MKIYNQKTLSQIRQEELENLPESVLEIYEIVAEMGEELNRVVLENRELRQEINNLNGGMQQ